MTAVIACVPKISVHSKRVCLWPNGIGRHCDVCSAVIAGLCSLDAQEIWYSCSQTFETCGMPSAAGHVNIFKCFLHSVHLLGSILIINSDD